MDQMVLREITHVYRFGINIGSWAREMPSTDHFIAYKLYGYTEHESHGKLYPFSKDMVMIANRRDTYRVTRHEFASEGRRGGCIAVHFTTALPFGMHLSVYDCVACPQLRSKFFQILDAWNRFKADGKPASKYLCAAHLFSIFSLIFSLTDGGGEVVEKNRKIAAAKAYLDRNYADSALSIADAADSVGLSQRRFGALFLEQYHKTPGRYLTSLRIAAAAELLREGSLMISEIAALTGYASANYFIRVFHREVGVSPSAYRMETRPK